MDFLTTLLTVERVLRGTRAGTRCLSCRDQAILVLRWFLDGTRMRQLATDNQISVSTGYDYLHEGIDLLAARKPSLYGAPLAAEAAGHDYVSIDGTLIETDRCRTPGPTKGVDLWWCPPVEPANRHEASDRSDQLIACVQAPQWNEAVLIPS